MKLTGFKRIYLSIILLLPLFSAGQVDDMGLWLGLSIEKKATRDLTVSLGEQIRFNHDVTSVDVLLSDIGFEYAFSKKLKAAFHYRFINSNQDTYYSKRHRVYIDVSYKEKFSILTLTLRERLQEQFNDIYSSETGKIPLWISRSKLTAKFDVNKKYTPYISGEVYYIIDNAKETDQIFSRFRYELGFNYKFNRISSLNPFLLYQHSLVSNFNELVYGITYTYSF